MGPTVMSGRVADVAVNPDNTTEFYVGYASGGLWYTNNNGTTFTPVLDNSPTQNVGDIAVDWNSGTIWVGTGEVNASRSSYAGIGLLKSTDKGKTWQNMGLKDSHHISKIVINPSNPDEVVVSAVGHLYSTNEERGVYKTVDGGKTWNKTLFVNDESGIIEMDRDPNNFDLIYASSWEKNRKAWNFTGSGEGSAIYKSTDGGDTWKKMSVSGSGFPTGKGAGRIGLAVVDENIVYAIIDNQDHREKKNGEMKKHTWEMWNRTSGKMQETSAKGEWASGQKGKEKRVNVKGTGDWVKGGWGRVKGRRGKGGKGRKGIMGKGNVETGDKGKGKA